MGTGQNYTKTKLHEWSILHEDTFARRQVCTRGQNCTKKIFHQASIFHELQLCTRVKITKIYVFKQKKILKDKLIKKQSKKSY